jgi:outer membrane receptor protein involved in Fe transport
VVGGIPHTFFNIPTRENHLQPQIVAQYKFLPRIQFFAKYVQGDKVGGVDSAYNGSVQRGANTTDAQFAPERAVSFEAGIKGITEDNRFEYSLTAYNTTFSNLQAGIFLGTTLFTTNVGKARSRGAELELTFAPVSGLKINGNAAFQNAKYLSYPNASCTVAQTELVPPCAPPGGQNLAGAPLPFASKFTGAIAATYQMEIGTYRVVSAGSVNYRSRYNTTTNNDHLGDQRGFATVDAHIDIGPDAGWWTASLFGRNLTDYKYREYGVATPLVPGAFNAFVARGRQLGIRFGAKFD